MDVSDRIREARQRAGFAKAADAVERFGWKYSTYASHENGSRGVGVDEISRYARAFRVAPDWLAFGAGDGETAPEPQRVEFGGDAPEGAALVPVYDVQASAGHGAFVEYEAQAHGLAFPPDYLTKLTKSSPQNLAIISVKGESMEPTLLDDDIVLLDRSKQSLGFDGLFVLNFDDTLHVKRVGRSAKPGHVTIISDHERFHDIERRIEDTQVVGKVLWYGRKV